jgi:acyl-CoA thioester hydrolase
MLFPISLNFEVRDYELDYQGIVNNAVYLNYFEEARGHLPLTLAESGEHSVVALQQSGITWVVSEINLKYYQSLRARQKFSVTTRAYNKGVMRIIFEQEITRINENEPVVKAVTTTACLINGKVSPFPPLILANFT